MLDEEMRRLPAVQTASMGVIPDPRLASWAEMCAIGRAFVVRHPTKCYAPTSDEFKEMVAVYLGAPSPLATQIGVGRRVHPMPRHTAREPHVGQVRVRTTGGPRTPRIHRFVALPP